MVKAKERLRNPPNRELLHQLMHYSAYNSELQRVLARGGPSASNPWCISIDNLPKLELFPAICLAVEWSVSLKL